MDFKNNMRKFPPQGDTLDPFIKGREEYLNFYGRLSNERNAWRKISMGLVGILAFMSVGMIYISTKSEFIPFMLKMDSQTGYVQAVGPVTESKYTPGEAEITYFLSDVIKKVRTVPLDPIAYKQNWVAAGAFMTAKTNQKMLTMINEEGQGNLLGKVTIQPNILSIQPLSNTKNTYQIRWTEEAYALNGEAKINANFSGTFTVSTRTPKDKKEYYLNPIGMVIEDFSWSQENIVETNKGGLQK